MESIIKALTVFVGIEAVCVLGEIIYFIYKSMKGD